MADKVVALAKAKKMLEIAEGALRWMTSKDPRARETALYHVISYGRKVIWSLQNMSSTEPRWAHCTPRASKK